MHAVTAPPAQTTTRQWALLATLCGTAFSVVLDGSTVITALPSIKTALGFSATDLHWIITAYSLSFGGLMILGGRLSDYFGSRRMFLTGVAVFAVASLACGLAATPWMLVAARFAQGAAGAVVLPAALSIVMKTFPEGPPRNKALAVWSSVAGAGGIVGFVVGGPLTDGPGWQWIFLMNVPIAIAVWFPSLRLIERDRAGRRGAFDAIGALTVTGALVLLVWTVSEVPSKGWLASSTLLGLAGVLVLGGIFTVVELRSSTPMVPFRIFRNRSLSGGNIALFLIGFAYQGIWFLVSLHIQGLHGFSATQFGAMMLAPSVTSFVGVAVGQRLTIRFSIRGLVAFSVLGSGLALAPLVAISADDATLPLIVASGAVMGFFTGIATVACSIAALTGVEEADHGIASGLEESTFMIGGPLGVATAATVAAWTAANAPAAQTAAEATTSGHRWGLGVLVGALLLSPLITYPLMRGGAESERDRRGHAAAPTVSYQKESDL